MHLKDQCLDYYTRLDRAYSKRPDWEPIQIDRYKWDESWVSLPDNKQEAANSIIETQKKIQCLVTKVKKRQVDSILKVIEDVDIEVEESVDLEISIEDDTNQVQCDKIVDQILDDLVSANVQSVLACLKRQDYEVSSESTEVVAGIDTSVAAVMQYVDSLLQQIKL